jgi:hypothetical protein
MATALSSLPAVSIKTLRNDIETAAPKACSIPGNFSAWLFDSSPAAVSRGKISGSRQPWSASSFRICKIASVKGSLFKVLLITDALKVRQGPDVATMVKVGLSVRLFILGKTGGKRGENGGKTGGENGGGKRGGETGGGNGGGKRGGNGGKTGGKRGENGGETGEKRGKNGGKTGGKRGENGGETGGKRGGKRGKNGGKTGGKRGENGGETGGKRGGNGGETGGKRKRKTGSVWNGTELSSF